MFTASNDKESARDKPVPKTKKAKAKVSAVMGEFKAGTLHSGGSGNIVTNPKQAVAISLSEARKKA